MSEAPLVLTIDVRVDLDGFARIAAAADELAELLPDTPDEPTGLDTEPDDHAH